MQPTSETYKALLAAGAPKEVRARIYVSDYFYNQFGQDSIVESTTRSSMLGSGLTVGNCIAKELNLVLRTGQIRYQIPRMAKIIMAYRLYDSAQAYSEWYPKGTFFIDTREEGNGVLKITAFDAMLKGEQSYMRTGIQGNWPQKDKDIVRQCAYRLGVSLDPRTESIITREFDVGYPGYGDGAYSVREVLGFIGQMYGGNWIITDEDKLRLIILGDIPDDATNLLVTQNGDYITIGGYRIRVNR